MASVRLDFSAPNVPDLLKLHIYEGNTATGPFTEIEVVTPVGTFPDYLSYYTTDDATSVSKWFAIEWEDDKGALFGLSQSVPGNAQTLVGRIVERVLLRDPSLNELIVTQEAEAAVSTEFGEDNPMTITASQLSLRRLQGFVLLVMARSYISMVVQQSQSQSYTAGLVSQKADSSSKVTTDLIKWLIDQANALLGTGYTVIMLLEDIDPTGIGAASSIEWDQSRLLLSIE